jgi:hypothetical protein
MRTKSADMAGSIHGWKTTALGGLVAATLGSSSPATKVSHR